ALAVALGLIALGWSLPPPLRDVTRLLGGITVPLMLVMLGLSLAGLRLHETWRPLLLSLVRVWGGFAVGIPHWMAKVPAATASMPRPAA
ncbi:hypothetical protein ACV35G_30690, partial [Pseudomonas aeruginosa]